MQTRSTDDWKAFTDLEHLFFGMANPFAFLRACIEEVIRQGDPRATVESVHTVDAPKHLAVASAESRQILAFAIVFRAHLEIARPEGGPADRVDATVSVFLGDLDKPGRQRVARFIDLGENGVAAFDDSQFSARFQEFQRELGLVVGGQPQHTQTSGLPEEAEDQAPPGGDGETAGQKKSAGLPAEVKAHKPWWKFWKKG